MYLGAGETHVLVDAGIAYRALVSGLSGLGLAPDDLDAVLVTHEHGDHVRGLGDLKARHPGVDVVLTPGTRSALRRDAGLTVESRDLCPGARMHVGCLEVVAFGVSHDAREPVGYTVGLGDTRVGVTTDLGCATPQVRAALAGCRLVVLEANHDAGRLSTGPYPAFLKRRVASDRGHLSNAQSAALLADLALDGLERAVLAHLSRTNNTPEEALAAVSGAIPRAIAVEAAHPRKPGEPIVLPVRSEDAFRPESAPGAVAGAPGPGDQRGWISARQLGLFD